MDHLLLTHAIESNRDVIRARQRARQIATLLGFDPRAQAEIAAACFVLGLETLKKVRSATLRFFTDGDALAVTVAPTAEMMQSGGLHLRRELPHGRARLAVEDVKFIIDQLAGFTPKDLFSEVAKQNLELIHILLELRQCEARLAAGNQGSINAA